MTDTADPSSAGHPDSDSQGSASAGPPWFSKLTGYVGRVENGLMVLCMALLIFLPLSERLLRTFFNFGILGVSDFTLHCSLFMGMVGGAIAARQGKLLAISTISTFLKGRWKEGAQIFSHSFAVVICVFLFVASSQFIASERLAGKILPYSIPVWILQLVLPFGFGMIALRLLWKASPHWKGRLITFLVAGGLSWLAAAAPLPPEKVFWPALILLLLATLLGAPIFTALGGLAVIYFWTEEIPISNVTVSHYSLVVEPMVPTIPLFTLAGYFLAESKASERLIRVFHAIFGRIRGGPVVVTVMVCAFFTTFTGASGVTILALGGLLMPVLLSAKFPKKSALGLLTGSGSLGLLFPPCLPLIFYFIVANSNSQGAMQLQDIFLGGVLPGILLLGMTSAWGVFKSPPLEIETEKASAREIWQAIWHAKWELMLPVVALGSLFSGIFSTPVAAAAVTALYAFIVETFIMRDLHLFRDVPRVITQCGLLVGGVLLILGMAFGFTNCLVDAMVPDLAIEWVTTHIQSKILFLLILNLLLILVGCFMDIFSAIVVVVPLLVPLGLEYGIDPIHLGIIFLANMELGYITPPVGMNLFLSSYRFNKPVMEIARSTLPMFFVLLAGVLIITYVPFLSTWLPSLFR